jgi:hypothetical protein
VEGGKLEGLCCCQIGMEARGDFSTAKWVGLHCL